MSGLHCLQQSLGRHESEKFLDQLITLSSAREYFRDEFGRTVHLATLSRWATRIKGRVKLGSFVLGGVGSQARLRSSHFWKPVRGVESHELAGFLVLQSLRANDGPLETHDSQDPYNLVLAWTAGERA